jgi:hypothetical protein
MLKLALWLKKNNFKPDQVQAFIPTPMALASAMYHTGVNPLKKVGSKTQKTEFIDSAKTAKTRRLHKALLRYHDPENWQMIRAALKRMGREELIGSGKQCLVPEFTPRLEKRGKATGRPDARTHTKKGTGDYHHRIKVKKMHKAKKTKQRGKQARNPHRPKRNKIG